MPELPTDPEEDQTRYLDSGVVCAERKAFLWRAPLYSAWLGILYSLSGRDVGTLYYLDKVAATSILALLIAWAGSKAFGAGAGLLAGAMAANSKYLVGEVNGSHVMAAVFFAGSLVVLVEATSVWRRPLALLLLCAATQVRQEAWLPFVVVVSALAVSGFRRRRIDMPMWIRAALLCGAMLVTLRAHTVDYEPHRISVAIAQNMATTYTRMGSNVPPSLDPMRDFHAVWQLMLPLEDPLRAASIIRRNPGAFIRHALFNARAIPYSLAAAILAPNRPQVILLTVALWLLVLLTLDGTTRPRTHGLPQAPLSDITLWSTAQTVLLGASVVLLAWTRYYVPVLPVMWLVIGRGSAAFGSTIIRKALDCRRVTPSRQR